VSIRKLDDYRYNEETGEVIHIYEARQPKDYDPKLHCIRYAIKSNKPRRVLEVSSKDKGFFYRFKRINKLKAKLLW
jgi:hypothetical protein